MKATRSNLPQLIAAAGGAVLIISLFLAWVSIGDAHASGWETFSFVDIVMFVIGIATLAVGAAVATGATLPVPQLGPDLLKWFGVITLTIVLTFLFENDNNGFGAFIGLIAALAILAGGVLTERPDLAARVADAAGVDEAGARPAARPPAGIGSPSSTGTPTAGGTSGLGTSAGASPPAGSAGIGGTPPGGVPAATPGAGAGAAGGVGAPGSAGTAPGGAGGGPPAGWYPDPQGQARLRYWDGAAWTEQTSA